MTTLGRNVAANIAGAVFAGVVTLAAAPLLLRWLGAEGYGLVGVQTTVQSLLVLFDLGLSLAINREIASLSATPESAAQTRSVLRTALPFYGGIALVFAVAMILGAPPIADRWLAGTTLPRATVIASLRLMAVALAAHFLSLVCTAGFLGLQRQALYSGLWSLIVALRVIGGVIVAFATHDVRAFFVWQVIASLVQLLLLAAALHRVMPPGRAEARMELLRGAWQLARGVAVIGVLGAITTQADKLAVSRSVSLTLFGYYSVAALLAMTAAGGIAPVANAAFPRFAQLLRLNDRAELALAYHRTLQTMAAIVLPIACVLGVWSPVVLFVWTGQPAIAATQSGIAMLLVAGMAMNGLLSIPYMLQLAHGWTTPAVAMNAIALVTFVPAMFVAAARWGPFGTAVVFASMHAAFLIAGLIVTHARLLGGSIGTFVRDVAPALLASASIAIAGRLLLPATASRTVSATFLAVVGPLALLASAAATPAIRQWVIQRATRTEVSP